MTHITDQHAADWVRRGAQIRVNAGAIGFEDIVMAEGRVISWCAAPSLTVEHADGTRSSRSVDLPMVELAPADLPSTDPRPYVCSKCRNALPACETCGKPAQCGGAWCVKCAPDGGWTTTAQYASEVDRG